MHLHMNMIQCLDKYKYQQINDIVLGLWHYAFFKVTSCVCTDSTKKSKTTHSLWLTPSSLIILFFAPSEHMLYLPKPHPIITEAHMTLFKINFRLIYNTKSFTLTASPPCSPLLVTRTSNIIIFPLEIIYQRSEYTSNNLHFI